MPRRSVSVRGATYDRLFAHCQAKGRSVSDVIEELVAGLLAGSPVAENSVSAEPVVKPTTERPQNAQLPRRAPPKQPPKPAPLRAFVSVAEARRARDARTRPAPTKASVLPVEKRSPQW